MLNYLKTLFSRFAKWIGSVSWKADKEIPVYSKERIKELLKSNYYIILTRRSNHLSTYIIGALELLMRFKIGYWSHALMNLEDTVTTVDDFRLLQATGKGVDYATFDEVFDVQSVALLKPKCMTIDEWTEVLDTAKRQVGKQYDSLFDIKNDDKVSCIELVRIILMAQTNYKEDFANFEAMITKYKNVSPQMLFDCDDFEVDYIMFV